MRSHPTFDELCERAGEVTMTVLVGHGPEHCFACRTPYHESTGHRFEHFPDVVYCGACARRMFAFVKGHVAARIKRKKKGGVEVMSYDFYLAAVSSIRAGAEGPLDQFGDPLTERTPDSIHPPIAFSEALGAFVVKP